MLAADTWRARTGATKTSTFFDQCRRRSAFAQTRGPARWLAKVASTGLPAGSRPRSRATGPTRTTLSACSKIGRSAALSPA